MPSRWEERSEAWQHLTTPPFLLDTLRAAIESNTLSQASQAIQSWKESIGGPTRRQWQLVSTRLTLSEIAALHPGDWMSLFELLQSLDPTARVPENIVKAAGAVDAPAWRRLVYEQLARLNWTPPLGRPAAWDILVQLMGQARPVEAASSLNVLPAKFFCLMRSAHCRAGCSVLSPPAHGRTGSALYTR